MQYPIQDDRDETKLLVNIIMLMEIKGIERQITGHHNSKQKTNITEYGIYALVHFVLVPLSYRNFRDDYEDHTAHTGSMLLLYARKHHCKYKYKEYHDMALVHMNNFHSTLVAVQDFEAPASKKDSFIFLRGKSEWMDTFFEHMKNPKTIEDIKRKAEEEATKNKEQTNKKKKRKR